MFVYPFSARETYSEHYSRLSRCVGFATYVNVVALAIYFVEIWLYRDHSMCSNHKEKNDCDTEVSFFDISQRGCQWDGFKNYCMEHISASNGYTVIGVCCIAMALSAPLVSAVEYSVHIMLRKVKKVKPLATPLAETFPAQVGGASKQSSSVVPEIKKCDTQSATMIRTQEEFSSAWEHSIASHEAGLSTLAHSAFRTQLRRYFTEHK